MPSQHLNLYLKIPSSLPKKRISSFRSFPQWKMSKDTRTSHNNQKISKSSKSLNKKSVSSHLRRPIFYRTQVRSLPCLVRPWVNLSISPCCETWLMWPRRVEIHVVDEQNKSYVVDAGFLSDPSLIIALPVCPWVSLSLSPCCENWLVPRPEVGRGTWLMTLTCEDSRNLPKSHAISPCLTSCCKFWQPCCWHWNKTKAMLLMSEQNKSLIVKIFKLYMNLSNLRHVFVKFVICISCHSRAAYVMWFSPVISLCIFQYIFWMFFSRLNASPRLLAAIIRWCSKTLTAKSSLKPNDATPRCKFYPEKPVISQHL